MVDVEVHQLFTIVDGCPVQKSNIFTVTLVDIVALIQELLAPFIDSILLNTKKILGRLYLET